MSGVLAALINGAIVSALVTVIVWLGMRAAHRRLNAATRYLVWWAVLAIALILPVWYLPRDPIPRVSAAPSRRSLPAPVLPREVEGPDSLLPPPAVVARPTPVSWRALFPIRIPARSVPQWFGATWAVVSCLMLLRLLISWEVLRRRKAGATEAPPSLSTRLDAWLAQCGSPRRQVRVAVSAEIVTPMVAGLGQPTILFPRNFLGALNQAELEQIGLHEAAHIARGDDCALIVQRIVEALLALHPVVRWVARRIDLEREIACDDFVVQASGNPRPYASCLTRVVELTSGVRGPIVAASVADERSQLTRRVDMLLDKSRHTGTRPLKTRLAATVTAIASVAWIAVHAPAIIVFAMPLVPESELTAPAVSTPPLGGAPPPSALMKPATQVPPRPSAPPVSQPISADVVTIAVAVREPRNRFVTGLDKSAFRLFEDGVEQEITQFRTRDVPISMGLLVDTSGNMGAKFAEVDEAVRQFLKVANPVDDFFVVQFDEDARLAIGFTGDRDEVQRQLVQMQPHGGSAALLDAVNLAMGQMREAHNSRKAILVITDAGTVNSTNYPTVQLLQELRLMAEFVHNNVPVYSLNIVDDKKPPSRFLADLTGQTGGTHFAVGGGTAALAEVAARIGVGLRNLYELEYTPKNTAHDGAYRKVQIELITPPGLPPLQLDYRPGYYESRR